MMHFPIAALLLAAAIVGAAEEVSTNTQVPSCTATSSTGSGAFFDLRPDMAAKGKTGLASDYSSKGKDYGKNFTLNICGAVVKPVKDVIGLDKDRWANVSAYYVSHGNIYSIGSQSMNLISRGSKLVLQYTGGSPCGPKSRKGSRAVKTLLAPQAPQAQAQAHEVETLERKVKDDEKGWTRQKSTTISFHCDRDRTSTQTMISFVGTDPDECAYFFEARSVHACAHAEPHKPGSVGPGSVFGIILLVAVLVYALGGVFYNRTVANARGWRQLPNYSLWAGIWGFISDMGVILFSTCTRCIPRRRGYNSLNADAHGRNRSSEAENRLIDQLDEEWDD
ncbi:hypothetical protein RJ55_07426 [Drechmeria coniospora]|nr:hypothetical protein RJ55_07426 [Drechmeria coniospora]